MFHVHSFNGQKAHFARLEALQGLLDLIDAMLRQVDGGRETRLQRPELFLQLLRCSWKPFQGLSKAF